jgi:hypothetical protein
MIYPPLPIELPVILLIWFTCGLIAAAIGVRKGEGFLAFIAGVMLGPIGILGALLSKGKLVDCPYCAERIQPRAVVCPHCQRQLPPREGR